GAFSDLDQLLRVTADILVQAEVVEIGGIVVEMLDLEDSAGAFRIVAESWRSVESEVRGDDPVPALGVAFGRRTAGSSALPRGGGALSRESDLGSRCTASALLTLPTSASAADKSCNRGTQNHSAPTWTRSDSANANQTSGIVTTSCRLLRS